MFSKKLLIAALCVAALAAGAAHAWAEEDASPQTAGPLDQRALDKLKLMSDTIAQAKTVRFQARSMVPVKSPDGMWVSLYGTSRVVKEGSTKLFAETRGDFFPYDFYFDGQTVTAYSPSKNIYAEKTAPGTTDSVIEEIYREEGKTFPYADILVARPYDTLTQGLIRAAYVGQTTLTPLSGSGGVMTNHLAFSNKGVEWQIWIGAEDHLPRMVCATYLDDVKEPSYTVMFGGWKIDEPVAPETFIFNNASQAAKVEFRSPMQQGRAVPSGAPDKQ